MTDVELVDELIHIMALAKDATGCLHPDKADAECERIDRFAEAVCRMIRVGANSPPPSAKPSSTPTPPPATRPQKRR